MNARLPMDDHLLIALWPTRLPERLLETRLGRPSSAIYRRARALGLPLRVALRESRGDFKVNTIKNRERREKRRAEHSASGPAGYGYDPQDDFARSLDVGYAAIRDRVAAGGPGWEPK